MGEILKFGAKQEKVGNNKKTGDASEGLDKLIDYLAHNCSIEVGKTVLDISSEVAEAAHLEGYMLGSGSWYEMLINAVDDDIISVDTYGKLLKLYIKLAGGNEDGAE